ncbi:MAG: hypothetical protein ACREOJ_00185, partial [Gemmatimonadaceae bacterium]
PWDRAALEMDFALKHLQENGLIVLPEAPTPTTPALIIEWFELITTREHLQAEVACLPGAWHGAIDYMDGAAGHNAFSFWDLDDFVSRFGCPVFREMAEALERSADRAEGSARDSGS